MSVIFPGNYFSWLHLNAYRDQGVSLSPVLSSIKPWRCHCLDNDGSNDGVLEDGTYVCRSCPRPASRRQAPSRIKPFVVPRRRCCVSHRNQRREFVKQPGWHCRLWLLMASPQLSGSLSGCRSGGEFPGESGAATPFRWFR